MGRNGRRCIVTGVGAMLAAGGPFSTGGGGGGGDPLTVTAQWLGVVPENVSGASGTSGGQFGTDVSGGTPPYTFQGWTLTSNPSGKIALENNFFPNTHLTYSGFSPSEVEAVTAKAVWKDSTNATANDSDSTALKRTS